MEWDGYDFNAERQSYTVKWEASGARLWSQTAWSKSLSLFICVTLGKIFNLSVFQSPCL